MRVCVTRGFVSAVVLVAAFAQAEVLELEGTVKAVDATARTMSVERKTPKGTKTLELEVNKKSGDLSSLKVGDRITFSYDPDLEIVTKISGGSSAPQDRSPATTVRSASKGPGEREKEICREACKRLEQDHFLKPRIDRDLSQTTLEIFLRTLDAQKMFFSKSDVDTFMNASATLPDALREGDVSLAYTIYRKFLERIRQRMPLIESLITDEHDFTKDERLETESSAQKWPTSDADAKDKWRKRIKYDLLSGRVQGDSEADVKARLLRRYRSVEKRWAQASSDEVLEGFLSSLFSSVDGMSVYMSPETLANFEIGMRMELDGIGAQLKSEDGLVTIVECTAGGAAKKDGRLKPNDQIIGIAQGTGDDFVDTQDMRLNDVVNLVRGKSGTVVRLKVVPQGSTVPRIYDITRAKITLNSTDVTGDVKDVGRKADGTPHRIGVIRIPAFYSDMDAMRKGVKDYKSSSRDCKALLEGFRRQKVDCVVVDIRDCGGGMLHEVIGTVGLFIHHGPVLSIRHKDGRVEKLEDKEPSTSWGGPLVILVSKRTASSAEVFAGAIQDYRLGVIVGDESTNGVAVSMNLLPVNEHEKYGSVKLLWACLYRASGDGIQKKGIRSDVVLPSVDGYLMSRANRSDTGLSFDRVDVDGFRPTGADLGSTVGVLKRKSGARIAADKGFRQVQRVIQRQAEILRDGGVALNEEEFTKQWKAMNSDSDLLEKQDFYLNEALNIAADLTEEVLQK